MKVPETPEHDAPLRTWNYRVIEFREGAEAWRAVHEVHYDDGIPKSYSETPAAITWFVDEGDAAAAVVLGRMHEAILKDALTTDDFSVPSTDQISRPREQVSCLRETAQGIASNNAAAPVPEGLVYRLRKRAEIRRNAVTRKSVQEGRQDRIADILEEAANRIEALERAKGER